MARNGGPVATPLGLAFAAVAVVGFVAFGWEFGGETEPIALALAPVAVVVAIGVHLFR